MSRRVVKSPPRLLAGDSESPVDARIARLLERNEQRAPAPGDADRQWYALRQALRAPARRPRSWVVTPVVVAWASVAVAGMAMRGGSPEQEARVERSDDTARVTRVTGQVVLNGDGVAAGSELASGGQLSTGADSGVELALSGGAAIEISERSDVRWDRTADGDELLLTRGEVRVAAGRDSDRPVVVRVEEFRMVIASAVSAVRASDGEVDIEVFDGEVFVAWPGADPERSSVPAGKCWSSRTRAVADCRAAPEPVRAESGSAPDDRAATVAARDRAAVREPAPRPVVRERADVRAVVARLVARGRHEEAIAALRPVARGTGIRAEWAQYELARIRHRRIGNLDAALSEYRTYLQRFPRGRLSQEVELSVIEIEVGRGRRAVALSAIEAFIARRPDSERIADLALQQGHLLRGGGDCEAAGDAYDRAARAVRVRIADEATYHAAVCLSERGRIEAARARLRQYLDRFPDGRYADAARRSLADRD